MKSACLAVATMIAISGCTAAKPSREAMAYRAVYAGVVASHAANPTAQQYMEMKREIDEAQQRELEFFYPTCVDSTSGGFLHALPQDWAKMPAGAKQKNCVYQARMTWMAAEVADRRPALREQYQAYARHGLEFLRTKMWDQEQGGFFWLVDDAGNVVPSMTDKHAYGAAFGIYACANVYEATKDPAALELAMNAFQWLEKHAHDSKNGGYYEAFDRAGNRILSADKSCDPTNPNDVLGTPYGYKTMNTHIHLMEAFATLYHAKPDQRVRVRFNEVFRIVRDRIAVKPGCLNYYFTPDWKTMPMMDSYGHDVETAYLLMEADTIRRERPDNKTRPVARSLVDHALQEAWDSTYGGFYAEGFAFDKKITDPAKVWWAQAEGLNALLLMHELYGKEDPRYWRAFVHQWAFIKNCQIAPDGAWYYDLERNGTVRNRSKLNQWKGSYHTGRALLNVSDRLARLAGQADAGAIAE